MILKKTKISGEHGHVEIKRDENGVAHILAENELGMCYGLGFAHAFDRGLQLLMMRILGQGRACELLNDSEEMLEVDLFFRRMNWGDDGESLDGTNLESMQAYCMGINKRFEKYLPWELKMLGYKYEKWTPKDSSMMAKMIGYLTLAQSQGELEQLVVELVQGGVNGDQLEELLPGLLGGLDLEALKKVNLSHRIIPDEVKWNCALTPLMASNNWVVSGKYTESGKPFLCNDPHLEINRLPNVWAEVIMEIPGRYAVGATVPGLPGLVIGRTNKVSWGATYTFLDSIDTWIEHCQDGKRRISDNEWEEFSKRVETIKRKKNSDYLATYHESKHGVLLGDPGTEGYYLSSRWSGSEFTTASLKVVFDLFRVDSVEEGMKVFETSEISFNWVLADTSDNIGYQMSGLAPLRSSGLSGAIPLPGWTPKNDWKGFQKPSALPKSYNPSEGYFVTANEDLNQYGTCKAITMPMGPYRSQQIHSVLKKIIDSGEKISTKSMAKLQCDLFSLEAKWLLDLFTFDLGKDCLPELLNDWDFCYDPDSCAPTLFELIRKNLLSEIFGDVFGDDVFNYMLEKTGIFADFFGNFNSIIAKEQSTWFAKRSRKNIFKKSLEAAQAQWVPQRWGDKNQIVLKHILLGDSPLGKFGFNKGPIPLAGGRSSVHQGQVYNSGGRQTSFGPSIRIIIDMAEKGLESRLIGGPSDRRFSSYYCSEIKQWLKGSYKRVYPKLGSV
ncbi:MAG: penicillin acylase family protein [Bacteriovoracaceae bacterium]|nr:penicillin acylase family protein [Bacteriovoracaceae bacterium]